MSDSSSQNGKVKLSDPVEDIPGTSDTYSTMPPQNGAPKILNDAQLLNGGLAPVQAWIRTSQNANVDASQSGDAAPHKSANADRVKRYKESKAANGMKQLNVIAPEDAHPVLKGIAEKTRAGLPVGEAIVEMTALLLPGDAEKQPTEPGAIKRRDDERQTSDGSTESSNDAQKPSHSPAINYLQVCEQQRESLQLEVTRLRQLATVGQKVLNLTGWRRELVSRLIGMRLVDHYATKGGTTRYHRRFFIFK